MKNGWTEAIKEKNEQITTLKAEVEQLRKAAQAIIDDGYPFEILIAAIKKRRIKMTFKEYEAYKYVRLKSDEFRFTTLVAFGNTHRDLVKAGEIAISAGTISIYPKHFSLLNGGSESLHIYGTKDDDFPLLEKVIGKPFKE